MDAVINSIITMEHKAQEMVDSAREEKQRLIDETQKRCGQLEADIVKRQENRLNKVAENEKAIIEAKLAEIGQENERKLASLEEKFAACKDAWVKEIVHNLIGGEWK